MGCLPEYYYATSLFCSVIRCQANMAASLPYKPRLLARGASQI